MAPAPLFSLMTKILLYLVDPKSSCFLVFIFTFKYSASEMCPKLILFKCLLDLGYVNPSVVFKGEIHREKSPGQASFS